MRIRWTELAAADLQSISEYLESHHPQYRQPTLRKIYAGIHALKEAAYRGRPGLERAIPPVLVYQAECSLMPGLALWRI